MKRIIFGLWSKISEKSEAIAVAPRTPHYTATSEYQITSEANATCPAFSQYFEGTSTYKWAGLVS